MLRPLLALLLALVLSGLATAQSTWYVDPQDGNDLNSGSSSAQAFQSITRALNNVLLASGDTILLDGGVYNAANGTDGTGNQLEVFPLMIPNGVSIQAGSVFAPPEIDGATTGGNLGSLFETAESYAALTQLSGLEFENCGNAITSASDKSIRGLVIEDCVFRNFSGVAVELSLRAGRVDDSFTIRDSSFTGAVGSTAGVRVVVSDTTTLDDGSIEDCTLTGSITGLWVEAALNGTIDRDFVLARNTISQFQGEGILVMATVGGSQNTVTVRGNIILGDGSVGTDEIGLRVLAANALGAGSPSLLDGLVSYNDLSRSNTNLVCESQSPVPNACRMEAVFAGNVVRNAVVYGVRFLADIAQGFAPDFGGKVGGAPYAGRNTFENATATWEIGLDPEGDINGPIAMSGNFWLNGLNPQTRTELFGPVNYPSFSPILSNTLAGQLAQAVIQQNQAAEIRIVLSNGRFVVQVDETFVPDLAAAVAEFGQYKSFELNGPDGTIVIQPADIQLVAIDGSEITFRVAGLSAGNYTITFSNPGFQSLLPIGLRVTTGSGGGGGGGGGCVVATAAHGDYNAPEVRVLRAFRDRYLLPHAGGRQAVRAYYQHGEPLALWIAERPWARQATRTALAVPTGLAWTLLHWNPGQRLLAAVLLLGSSFWLLRRRN